MSAQPFAAILLAAGNGSRMGGEKMSLVLCGKSALRRSAEALCACEGLKNMVIVVSPDTEAAARELARDLPVPCGIVPGGERRQDSVYEGLKILRGRAEVVAIHDGARCLVTRRIIEETVRSAWERGSGVAAMPVKDTIKRADGDRVETTLERRALQLMQTPQTFRMEDIWQAYDSAQRQGAEATDDASLLERQGKPVYLTRGSYENIKLTTQEDLTQARAILHERGEGGIRIGFGEDTHRLAEGRRLILGGVDIPFPLGLLGHSDADVLAHAVMDALLGAGALGDLGRHFPDSDPAYAGADSMALLRQVAALLAEQGLRPVNIDATIVAQRPKLAPYIPGMRQKLAQALGISVSRVSVKATTSEGLGFEGRGEGVTARCAALLQD